MKITLTLRARSGASKRRKSVVEDRVDRIEIRERLDAIIDLVAIRGIDAEVVATLQPLPITSAILILDAQGREVESISIEESPQL